MQISELNPISLSYNRNYTLKKNAKCGVGDERFLKNFVKGEGG